MVKKQNILIILAHPDMEHSRVNKALARAAAEMENVVVRDLYKEYPDGKIDAKKEQDLLIKADVVVFQFPFYWYSSPALLKEWEDTVLEYGFAYGQNGKALEGKGFFIATSTGGPAEAYGKTGRNQFSIEELLAPFRAMANLCGMKYNKPFVVNKARTLKEDDLIKAAAEYGEMINSG